MPCTGRFVGTLLQGMSMAWRTRLASKHDLKLGMLEINKKQVGSIVACGLLICLIFAILFPVFVRSKSSGPSPELRRIKQLGISFQIYIIDHDDRLPPEPWIDSIDPYVKVKDIFDRLGLANGQHYGFAYHYPLILKKQSLFDPEKAVLLFETDALGRNVVANLAARCACYKGGSTIAFLDSHVRYYKIDAKLSSGLVLQK